MRARALLSIQRALLGEVFPALRAVTVDWGLNHVKFTAYVDGDVRQEDDDALSCVSAEVAADFEAGIDVAYEVVRRDAPAPIDADGAYAFLRREP